MATLGTTPIDARNVCPVSRTAAVETTIPAWSCPHGPGVWPNVGVVAE
jgi:hypothetical protein